MPGSAQHVLEQALALPEEERRHLAMVLLESVSDEPADEVQRAWRDVVLQRIGEVERHEVELESWADVERHVRRALDRSR